MIIGIDSYCFHRYFGEIYDGLEVDPGSSLTQDGFFERLDGLGVAGVSLESCFFPDLSADALAHLKAALDQRNLARVWAWGHPNGLHSGKNPEALDDLIRHIGIAKTLGATVMRICAGGRRTRPESWAEHRAGLLPMLRHAANLAGEAGVTLAIENHIDLLADELLDLLTTIDSPALGVCLDTANNLRMFEEPMGVVKKLAPFTRATHIKDITTQRGDPKTFGFWPSVPLGTGLIDIPQVLRLLKDANYAGLLALEIDFLDPRFADGPAIGESLAFLRKAVAGL